MIYIIDLVNGKEDIEQEEESPEENIDRGLEPSDVATPLDMQLFLVEPTAKKEFSWINKDMTLTYLDELDLAKARELSNLINTLMAFGLKESAKLLQGDLANILNSARSRHGFERQIQNTRIQKGFSYYDGQEEQTKNGR